MSHIFSYFLTMSCTHLYLNVIKHPLLCKLGSHIVQAFLCTLIDFIGTVSVVGL